MAVIRQYPIPVDALPLEVGDAYESLALDLSDWLSAPSPFSSDNLVDYFEEHLAQCGTPETRIRYLCRLTMGGGTNREGYPEAADDLKRVQGTSPIRAYEEDYNRTLFIDTYFFSWLAVRLTEAVCEYAGSSRLRGARASLWAEWEATAQRRVMYRTDDHSTRQLLRYLFGVLIPFAGRSRTQSLGNVAEQFRQSVPRPTPAAKPPLPPPDAKPQNLEMLCQNGLTPANVRDLLAQLGAIDAQTGHWHLGELTGKPGKVKSAFPAAYRALADKGLLLKLEGPTWRQIFVTEFKADISLRMANYDTKGQASNAFHDYYAESLRWITIWKAEH
ncbi:hypothetical protein [Hymenobacter sp. IS2118]|uniref:hypothetical protein n=1 Tax=Hymenobacter sp. IS2118 TaxID=1505605 RepID=UPI0005500E7F|nr:hypothetical protein [Hymenobacter sp. IS2118]